MRAVFKRELQSHFYTASAYVFMLVFLALGSVFFAVGNLAARSGDLTGLLWNMGYLWMLLAPVLTMRVYAGERKSRTDQLLLTAPVSLSAVVLGKYLACCAVLLLTVALSGFYVLAVGLWGRVYAGETLCAYLGFFLQGCAFLAIDLMISSRCRGTVTAAVWAFGVNLALWLLDVICEAVSAPWLVRALRFLSPYMRAAPFRGGQLSLANCAYFVAVIALSLFWTVRALDARRLSAGSRRAVRSALLSLLAAAVAVCAVIVADLWETRAAARIDLSFNRVTTRSAATDEALRALQKDVHAYVLSTEGNELSDLNALLDRYQAATPHFTWSSENLSAHPQLLRLVSDDARDEAVSGDCVIVRCEETGRTRVLTWDDYMRFGFSAETGEYAWTGLTYEEAVTGAVIYVTTDELPRVQLLTGHGEPAASETAALEKTLAAANYAVSRLNLREGAAPDPAATLMILSPLRDLNESETALLSDFVQAGGSLLVTADYGGPENLPNFFALYRLYGVSPRSGLVLADENDPAGYYTQTSWITPELLRVDGLTDRMLQSGADFLILAPATAWALPGEQSANLVIDTVLQSRPASYLHTGNDAAARRADDPAGPFPLAVLCDRAFADGTRSRAFFAGNSAMFTNETVMQMTYSPELLLQVLRRLNGGIEMPEIAPRQALREPLTAPAGLLPVLPAVLPPLLIAILAAAVLLPRRYL